MSLRIVYGNSGTGKSTYIFNEISHKLKNNSKRKIYIITPEQFSFTAEKKLLDVVKPAVAVVNAEVLTFNRMAYRVMKKVGNANFSNLSSSGKSMLIYNILSEEKNNLKFIGKSNENVELISTQITEFKKHGIKVENIKNILENIEDKYLNSKLCDMLKIYEKYNEEISEKYIDENDNLTILAQMLDLVDDFDDVDIYIDEFVGFTYQEFEIIKKLMIKANEVNITVCTDIIEEAVNPDTDIFYENKLTLSKIYFIAREQNIKIEKPVELNKKYRFKNEELKHLEENIYAFPYKKYKENVENINLFLAKNQYSEIENVAKNIVKLVRDNGYRYKDISVITKDLEGYSSLCKAIFAKYEIPVFIDEKKDLNQNILVKYIISILNIFAKNWSYESMFEYIKTGFLTDLEDEDIWIIENYILRWAVKGSKWYKGEWNFYNESDEEKEKILHIRKKIVEPLLKLKEALAEKKDVKSITIKLYEFLIENEINIKLENKIKVLEELGEIEKAKEYETSYKIIIDVFDEIVSILGDKKVNFEKYVEILKTGLGNSGLGKIPISQDEVTVGDVDRSRSHKVKAVFIIGLNDGMFPSINKNEGFFSDKDREVLKTKGAELAKGTIEKLYDDNFNIYKAFSTSENKIYLSYASSDIEGKSLRPSILINRLKKIFINLKEESDIVEIKSEVITENTAYEELLTFLSDVREDKRKIDDLHIELFKYYSSTLKWKYKLENSMNALDYNIKPDKINQKVIDKLYGDTLKTSVSRLEQYKACPFSYYLKYGLNLSEREEFKIQPIDTGTFMHEVIDSFFDKISERKINLKVLTDETEKNVINELIDEIIEEKLQIKKNYIFASIPKYIVLANRLRKVIKKSMIYIVDSLRFSDFEIMGHELEFKNGKEYSAIEIEVEDGEKVEITGKIDRIDIAKTPEGNYIRIIDYKSSTKDINLNEVVAGLQLQLLTYLDAVCNIEDVMPAGILYFNLIDPKIKLSEKISEEKIEEELRKQFKMKGLILADVNIVKKMDKKLEKGNSNIIPAYIDKDGNLANRQSTITKSEFENLQNYTNKIIKQISKEIFSGSIDIKPYYNLKQGKTPCDYCKYKSICNFNNGICKKEYNYIGNAPKDYILEQIKNKQ